MYEIIIFCDFTKKLTKQTSQNMTDKITSIRICVTRNFERSRFYRYINAKIK